MTPFLFIEKTVRSRIRAFFMLPAFGDKRDIFVYKTPARRYNRGMYIADLHIHSKYSRATGKNADIPHLDFWARRKGIGLVGTGDFTHPAWREELSAQLEPAEEGLYRIKENAHLLDVCEFPVSPRFVLSGEISCIYKQDGKVRKVHNVILLPSLDAAERLSFRLERIGNIRSDGRPILGLSSKDLLAITLDTCPDAVFIPAHIWTPHFSLFGAFSGFDSVEECFGDLSPHIRALETGLSSDPLMNRRVPMLDGYTMVSNSDAHSPAKLGRESSLIDAPLSYPALKRALETGEGFAGTLEFYPEEGKYHLDGHRNCRLRLSPQETEKYGGRCPVCGKKITVGVLHRLEQLAARPEGYVPENAKPFEHLMPLPEAIAASLGVSAAGRRAEETYVKLLRDLGTEAHILREASLSDLALAGGARIAEGIRRLRAGRVIKSAGFDGEYGKISLFTPEELKNASGQLSLFGEIDAFGETAAEAPASVPDPGKKLGPERPAAEKPAPVRAVNAAQLAAAESDARVTAVIAGPGTGKTFTLTERIARLVERGAEPEEICAVTFTVRAAEEMRARLRARVKGAEKITVGTFHSICYAMSGGVPLAERALQLKLAAEAAAACGEKCAPRRLLADVSAFKNGRGEETPAVAAYCRLLREAGAADFDDLIALALKGEGRTFALLHVDEFQDADEMQYRLIRKWMGERGKLFVIGDPDQSIYSFRGAAADRFDRLLADFPDAVTVRLTESYRSTPQVLECALRAISANGGERALTPVKEDGAAVRLVACASPLAEGVFIAKEIARMAGGLDMLGKGREEKVRTFGDIAVLARTHRMLQAVEQCLRREGIPCLTASDGAFLEAPEVSGTLSFFGALCGGGERAQAEAFLGGGAAFDAAAEKFRPLLRGRPRKVLDAWRTYLHIDSPAFAQLADAARYTEMREFLEAMRTGGEGDVLLPSGNTAGGAVRLATLHGAKGLEFPVVFLCGANEDLLPLSVGGKTDREEERRLFYVGITRAEEELVITTSGRPSPFLAELPEQVVREKALPKPVYRQLSLF